MTSVESSKRPRYARIWRGRTPNDRADEYERYLLQNGIKPLEAKGALGVQMFREDRQADTEFMTISYWDSVEAMAGDTKADPHRAHHLERDAEFLIELPQSVQILTILAARGAELAG